LPPSPQAPGDTSSAGQLQHAEWPGSSTEFGALEREIQAAAAKVGLEPIIVLAAGQKEYPAAFQMMKEHGAQALVIGANPRFAADAPLLITHAREAGLPTACGGPPWLARAA